MQLLSAPGINHSTALGAGPGGLARCEASLEGPGSGGGHGLNFEGRRRCGRLGYPEVTSQAQVRFPFRSLGAKVQARHASGVGRTTSGSAQAPRRWVKASWPLATLVPAARGRGRAAVLTPARFTPRAVGCGLLSMVERRRRPRCRRCLAALRASDKVSLLCLLQPRSWPSDWTLHPSPSAEGRQAPLACC